MLPSTLRRLVPTLALIAALAPSAVAMEPLEILPDGKARARIGDVKLYHDPSEWRIDGEGDAFSVWCRGVECDDPMMSIDIVPEDQAACSPGAVVDRSVADFPGAWTRSVAPAPGAVGLAVHVVTLDQGCRNLAGSPVHACTAHKGRSYWFTAPGEHCRTSAHETQALLHLLNGLTAAELTDE